MFVLLFSVHPLNMTWQYHLLGPVLILTLPGVWTNMILRSWYYIIGWNLKNSACPILLPFGCIPFWLSFPLKPQFSWELSAVHLLFDSSRILFTKTVHSFPTSVRPCNPMPLFCSSLSKPMEEHPFWCQQPTSLAKDYGGLHPSCWGGLCLLQNLLTCESFV